MKARLGFLRRQSLRLRITLAFVATAAMLSLVLSTATYFSVRSFLEGQRIRSATRQTVLGVLFAYELLGEEQDLEQLVASLQTRGGFEAMVTSFDDWFSTEISLTPTDVPAGLAGVVADEQLGYQLARRTGERVLVFGAPLPPQNTDLYLFYPLDDIDETMSLIARVLTVAGLAAVGVSMLLSQRIAQRLIRPLHEVGVAAERIAEGLLETRVESESSDEVGVLALSFNQMAGALQEMIARERRFVSNVSHELRTPLAALRTASDLLASRQDELPPTAREAAQLVAEDVANLQRLVQDLLEVSAVDAGRASVRWESVDLHAAARALVEKRRVDARVDGAPTVTLTDKARIERILANLIDNAYEHGEGRDVRVAVGEQDGVCTVAITDSGPGIAAEDVPRLFDRFYKADRSRTRERGGIGLGLAIAQENARLLGGRVEVTSRPGAGASFTLVLPKRADGEEPQ